MENENSKSCLSCKLISVGCLCGIGGYLLHTSKIYKNPTKIALILLGIGSASLGVGEIFNMSPFRRK